jgi:hypothetical protein
MRSCILFTLFPNLYKYLGNQYGSRVPQLLCVLRLRRYGFAVAKFSESNRGYFGVMSNVRRMPKGWKVDRYGEKKGKTKQECGGSGQWKTEAPEIEEIIEKREMKGKPPRQTIIRKNNQKQRVWAAIDAE